MSTGVCTNGLPYRAYSRPCMASNCCLHNQSNMNLLRHSVGRYITIAVSRGTFLAINSWTADRDDSMQKRSPSWAIERLVRFSSVNESRIFRWTIPSYILLWLADSYLHNDLRGFSCSKTMLRATTDFRFILRRPIRRVKLDYLRLREIFLFVTHTSTTMISFLK